MLIGNKIRDLRKAKRMTLTDLSKESGIQLATLSRIENNKMTGTLQSHMSIAKALGVNITEFYGDVIREESTIDLHQPSSPTDVFFHNDKASYEILTGKLFSKKMMPVLLKIEPEGRTTLEQGQAGAEKFVFVLEGNIEVAVGEERYSLSKHSTLYFDASTKHYIANAGKSSAKVLCISTPVVL
jgi:transcriptional regulator with XRE-family HTH domain